MRYLTLSLITALILTSTSCMKSKGDIEQVEPLRNVLTSQGSWRISSLTIGIGADSTSKFDGYSFVFTNDGNVSATSQTSSIQGIWNISYTLPADINQARVTKLTLSFPYSSGFDIITKVWTSTGISGTIISFSNTDNYSTDLIFTKN